jgi:nucleoside-diphosphate-sugar epimerase
MLPFTQADVAKLDDVRPLCHGVNTVLHLATASMRAPWESLLSSDIVGTYNVFLAARAAGCQRVVFTSSIQAVDGAAPELTLPSDAPVRPTTLYGAAKAWGEAAGSYFAYQYGLSIICLRLGWVTPRDGPYLLPGNPNLRRVLTHDDLISLLIATVEAPEDVQFAILNGSSGNCQMRLDISETRRLLHYAPQDDAFALAARNQRSWLHRVRRWGRRGKALVFRLRHQIGV